MEALTKQQLTLLALLVSFVTSIATGIVTVSLVNQAPPGVTQTINRVVEKTIERVVTEPSKQTAAAVVTKETVVVKADDLVVAAIEKNAPSVVRIKEVTGDGETRKETNAGLGLVVSASGLIAADIALVYRVNDEAGNPIPESYLGVFANGKSFPLDIAFSDKNAGLIFFKPLIPVGETDTFTMPTFGGKNLKLGQAVIAIGGAETNAVSTGIVATLVLRLMPGVGGDTATTTAKTNEKELISIKTDIRSSDLVSGSVLLNLTGEVIGINAGSVAVNRNVFLPIGKVLELLPKVVL